MKCEELIEKPEGASLLLFHALYRAIDNDNYSRCKHNGCQILLFRSAHRIVKNNDFHFDYGSIFGVLFRLIYQIVRNNNSFSEYYEGDYGNNSNNTYILIVVFFESVYQIMIQIQVSCNGLYDRELNLLFIIIRVRNNVCKNGESR